MLPASPKVGFPSDLGAFEIDDTISLVVTVSPDGKVEKVKAVGGKVPLLKDAAEKTVKQWAFEPYAVNGAPVRLRTHINFHFNNTLDTYHDAGGNTPVRLDENASHALLLKSIPPQYPPDARASRIQGQVRLRMIIGKDGHVKRLHVISGHPLLAQAAFNAVRQWTFKPYTVNGVPAEVDTPVTVSFTLSG